MKNIGLCGFTNDLKAKIKISLNKKLYCLVALIIAIIFSPRAHAQFVNYGDIKVEKSAVLSVFSDYDNKSDAQFVNDGNVFVFKNWINNGIVTFTSSENGKTHFIGQDLQRIEGAGITNFQNVIFDNISDLVPFQLGAVVAINKKAEFLNGIIDCDAENGEMIFNETAIHVNASDISFVDGKVQKKGNTLFEYPIGDDLYFRPSYSEGETNGNVYTAQYFYKNSGENYNHSSKDPTIGFINNTEYWTVTKEYGGEKLVLSLTMDSRTTPSEFFNLSSDKEAVIVRWDVSSGKWVKEGGVTSDKMPDAILGAQYTQLVTSEVKGYGIFTIAITDKKEPLDKDLVVYNALSPNGDGINDTFHIKGIDEYPDNTVEIYNRWGVKVFETRGYNETDNVFAGYSDGRATMNRNEKLPTGTYFYILKYSKGNVAKERTGYLYINNQ